MIFVNSTGSKEIYALSLNVALKWRRALPRSPRSGPARDRMVLHLRFVEDLTQSQIAERIGVSQMHVSRLIRGALERVREGVGE